MIANFLRERERLLKTLAEAANLGDLHQHGDGSPTFLTGSNGSAGNEKTFRSTDQINLPKTAGITILDGGRVYWDRSAQACSFKKIDDRDFYVGRAVGDASSAAVLMAVNLGVDPPYDIDLARDPFSTTIIGTQALGGLALNRRGGAHNFKLDATNEAQKLDALSKDGFATGANAIIEFAFNVISDGAGSAVDVSLGIANATHATDADAITRHLLLHLDANATAIKLQSKDGTTTVTASDTTKTYVEGAGNANRKEVWFDLRNPADVQVYIDAVNVLSATVFDISASVATWYLLAHLEKTASTDTYEIDLEGMRARFSEQ